MAQIITAEEAAKLIKDNSMVAVLGSGGGLAEPSLLLQSIESRFNGSGHPRDISVFHACGIGNKKGHIGTEALAHEGLVKRDIAGHWGLAPKMAQLAFDEKIEAYNLPQGVMSLLYESIAGHRPGVITKIGLHTFIDPREEGGKMNRRAKESGLELVKVIELEGQEWLMYPSLKIDVSLIRGTTADPQGNITFEEETSVLVALAMSQAAHNCGGIVIAQVKRLSTTPARARDVVVPGILADYIVVNPEQTQTSERYYDPALSGELRTPLENVPPLPMGPRKIVARRAAMELRKGDIVNLGVGMPDGIASVAAEMGILGDLHFTVEQGVIGGMPLNGIEFGASHNPDAIISQQAQFNFYDGGGLDCCCLGMAQVDREGNVNSSKTGKLLSGCGGAINISQPARKVVFCGTFTAKGLRETVHDGRLEILQEGAVDKFVDHVDQVTFSGRYSSENRQPVIYVTERAVFELRDGRLVLTEIAPGIDLEKDILSHMAFRPVIPEHVPFMDEKIFME